MPKDRYKVVTDLPEYTVHDLKYSRDIFPTKSGNRDYQCNSCTEKTAKKIAAALNVCETLVNEPELPENTKKLMDWGLKFFDMGYKFAFKDLERFSELGGKLRKESILSFLKEEFNDLL